MGCFSRGVLCALLLSLAPSPSRALPRARGWQVADLPSPDKEPAACGRPHRSSVCNPDGLLDEATAVALDEAIHSIGHPTSASHYPDAPACNGKKARGYELAVAVVRKAGGSGSAALRAETLARGLHDSWGVGDECGSGVVMLVAVEDRQVYLSTGTAASSLVTQNLELILDSMRPLLREGEVGQAVQAGVHSTGEVLAGRLSTRAPVKAWLLLGLAFLAFIAVQWWQEEKKKKRYAQATRQLTALEAAAAEAKAARYACTSCPICMEDFAVEGGAESEKKADSGRDIRPPSAGLQKSLLRCGHSFCAPCLARALAAKLACPICRAPPDGPEPRSPSLARQASSSSGGAAAAAGPASCSAAAAESAVAARDWDGFMPELVFRLRRLQVLYPDVVSHGMVDRWTHSSHLLEGGFANDQAFLRADPSRRPPVGAGGGAMARSTSGTSPRFGGGKSGGGGGGGW